MPRTRLNGRNRTKESEATIRKTLTERELAEDALIESEESYRELVENANDIVYTLDIDGRLSPSIKPPKRLPNILSTNSWVKNR